jgi:hypothetical protein
MMAKADYRLPQDVRDRVSVLIGEKGQSRVATLLGVSATTLRCAVAGLDIQPGTGALIEKKLAERDGRMAKMGIAATNNSHEETT